MEIKLERKANGIGSSNWVDSTGLAVLCHDGLRRRVEVPRHVREAFLVFTKKPNSESWTIGGRDDIAPPGHRTIKEYNGGLHSRFMVLMETAYGRGYRYVHLEYEA